MSASKTTPMFRQYLGIKEEYPDALLFYRMGDFYEMFFEDAEIAARELSIALTTRNPNDSNPVPMCGVPHHSARGYLAKLLDKGFKVAICDQVEDPKQAKGLVKRAVTRILTPGTVLDDANLEEKQRNFLAALCFDRDKGRGGLAWLDFSTGHWSGLASGREDLLWQWAHKIAPRELLLEQEYEPPREAGDLAGRFVTVPSRSHFDQPGASRRVLEVQEAVDLEVLDLHDKPMLVRSCGALVAYLRQTQMRRDLKLGEFVPLNLSRCLLIDEVTERNLEIFQRLDGGKGRGTLWRVLDRTKTPMGGRLLADRLRRPFKDAAPIEKTQDAVARLFEDDSLRDSLRRALEEVYDLERLSTRIYLDRAQPKDFIALKTSLAALPGILEILGEAAKDGPLPSAIQALASGWDGLDDQAELLEMALVDSPPPLVTEGGLFKTGYDADLDELIQLTERGEALVKDLLAREKEQTGLEKLRLGFNKVFGYFFELPKAQSAKAPERFTRRQTLVNSERFITPELKELEDRLLSATDKRKELEYSLFNKLRTVVAAEKHRFMDMAERVAALDLWQGLAEAARISDWVRPELHDGLDIHIQGGRHPVVEAVQGAAEYVPNDLSVTGDKRILVVTGPNMAGKSTVLRQAAIICIMAQIGSFVPASSARIGLCDRIFSRVGASDNLSRGQSTFMVEMTETARILRQAGARSLVILDEIGRGTSTFDGLALAWAVVEELARRGKGGVRTLFATHYHELTVLENELPQVANFNIAVKEYRGDIVFLRRLIPGPSDRSYGIEVAKLAGVPRGVVARAKSILGNLEERSRSASQRRDALRTAAQDLLPGLSPPKNPPGGVSGFDSMTPGEKALIDGIKGLTVETLTPVEALNLIHTLKNNLEKED